MIRSAWPALILAALSIPAPAAAQASDHRLVFRSDWIRVGAPDLIVGGAALAGFGASLLFPFGGEEHWRGGILLDDPLRDLARAESSDGRQLARRLSDWLLLGAVLEPLVDATLVTWAGDHNSDLAGQLIAMDLEALALTGLINSVTKQLVGRARPYTAGCEDDPEYDPGCRSADRFRSFFSGHSAFAFTAAGLSCAHHRNLPLWGSTAADSGACVGMLAVASSAAALRMIADQHYFSDVLVGAVLGFSTGYLLPALFHYQSRATTPGAATQPLMLSFGAPI